MDGEGAGGPETIGVGDTVFLEEERRRAEVVAGPLGGRQHSILTVRGRSFPLNQR